MIHSSITLEMQAVCVVIRSQHTSNHDNYASGGMMDSGPVATVCWNDRAPSATTQRSAKNFGESLVL